MQPETPEIPARIVSGGNFHAEPVAFASDQTALALSEIGAIAQRRVALLVDPNLNFGLPPFLSPDAGVNSGFMVAEITSAALMSEIQTPCQSMFNRFNSDQRRPGRSRFNGHTRGVQIVENE